MLLNVTYKLRCRLRHHLARMARGHDGELHAFATMEQPLITSAGQLLQLVSWNWIALIFHLLRDPDAAMRIRIGRFLFLPLVACVLSVSAALERLDGAAPSKRNETDDILAAVRTAAEELRDGKAGAARERLFPLLDGIPLRWCFQNPVPSVLLCVHRSQMIPFVDSEHRLSLQPPSSSNTDRFHRLATVEAVLGNVENAIQLSRVASILHTWMASHGPPAKVLDPIADSVLAGSQQVRSANEPTMPSPLPTFPRSLSRRRCFATMRR